MNSPKQHALTLTLLIVLALPEGLAAQKAPSGRHLTNYQVFTLPNALGGTVSGANAINDLGWAMGFAASPANTLEAAAWIEGRMVRLGVLPGGKNSSVPWESVKNNHGLIVGISDTSTVQPRGETFSCVAAGFLPASGNTCLGFLWQPPGFISELPTLGGDNGFATGVNNKDQVIGWAETSYQDPTCNPPQVLQFLPYVYDVKTTKITALQVYPGDSDGTADAINDQGQIAGISGICSNAVGGASAIHAVFWQDQNTHRHGKFRRRSMEHTKQHEQQRRGRRIRQSFRRPECAVRSDCILLESGNRNDESRHARPVPQ
jgi:uncharacterized membrane protein